MIRTSRPFALVFFFLSAFISSAGFRAFAVSDIPRDSLYQMEGQWKNQDGEAERFPTLQGQPVVISMTYTGCQFSCPLTINKLLEIERDFKKKGVQRYKIVIASFDAEKDKPEVLKAYMKKRNLDAAHWTFLSASSDEEVRKMAVLLDISYQKIEGGDFSHSNTVTLLDPVGRVAMKLKGLASAHEELVERAVQYEKKN